MGLGSILKDVQKVQRLVIDDRKFAKAVKDPSLKNIANAALEGAQAAALFSPGGAGAIAAKAALRTGGKAAFRKAGSTAAEQLAAKAAIPRKVNLGFRTKSRPEKARRIRAAGFPDPRPGAAKTSSDRIRGALRRMADGGQV
jgi:hypothetical protein